MAHTHSLELHPLSELRSALDQLAEGLTVLSLHRLLQSEQRLAQVLARIRASGAGTPDVPGIRATIEDCQARLSSCRSLGASLSELTQNLLELQSMQPGYTADGRGRPSTVPTRVQARA
jgi:hypothetical protein